MMFMKIRMPFNDGAGKHIIKSHDSALFANTHVQLRINMLRWRLIINIYAPLPHAHTDKP